MKFLACLALLVFAPAVVCQSNQKPSQEPKFSELSPENAKRLHQQRALIAAAVKKRYGAASLTRTNSDLPLLQKLLDEQVFTKSQTYELQSLGVAFGDVLASELHLRWVMVTDEYGTDPTLRFKNTSISVNALTMISRRVEDDEQIDVFKLMQDTRDALSDAEKQAE